MPTPHSHQDEVSWIWIAVVVVLACSVLVALWLLVRDITTFYRAGRPFRPDFSRVFTPTHLTVDNIEPWMTFEYLSHVFVLPSDVLKNKLAITDPRYPRLSIQRYAADANLSEADALSKVKAVVTQLAHP